ncbi:MAG: hypothetical protein AAFQ41_12210 [Cyanobacteria bacterium J06623_7]
MTVSYQLPQEVNRLTKTFKREHNYPASLSKKIDAHLEVDRLFVCVKQGEKAISSLRQLGLYCPNTIIESTSQGTRSQIFFFHNIYLAVIWLGDKSQPQDLAIDFAARVNWQDSLSSPFGIGLSRKKSRLWLGDNPYPVDDLIINHHVGYSQQNQKNSLEPLVFMLPDRLKYSQILNQKLPQNQKYLNHPLGVNKITQIKMSAQPGKRRDSQIISWIKSHQLLEIERTQAPLMELTFDNGVKGKIFDARPTLPIIFRY